MIHKVLNIIINHIKNNLANVDSIKLSALSKEGESKIDGGIIVTLLHIQEESSVKPQLPMITGGLKKKNPEVLLNVFILVSAQDDNYETALKNISAVIALFQANSVLHIQKSDEVNDESETYKLSLHPMSLEQNLSMWQTLGDRLMPSVVYKISVITVQASEDIEETQVQRIGLAYDRYSENDSESAKEDSKKSAKDILGKGEDVVFTKSTDGSKPKYLNDDERAEAKLPKATKNKQ